MKSHTPLCQKIFSIWTHIHDATYYHNIYILLHSICTTGKKAQGDFYERMQCRFLHLVFLKSSQNVQCTTVCMLLQFDDIFFLPSSHFMALGICIDFYVEFAALCIQLHIGKANVFKHAIIFCGLTAVGFCSETSSQNISPRIMRSTIFEKQNYIPSCEIDSIFIASFTNQTLLCYCATTTYQ